MSWIAATDPLALVAIQAGQIGTPSTEAAAAGANQLDTQQRSTEIGEPVPIVFARRRNNNGGVLISPGATECRFENNTDNDVTAYYHLVLSEGRISSIEVRDIFQGACRVGQYTQTYDRRAGTWTPANVIVEREGFTKPEASYYCGSIGRYPKMSTLSFRVTIPNGFDQWNRQVHAFIRGGIWVTRLFDNVTGPSDNFADLVRWLLLNSGRLNQSLIDAPGLLLAAAYLEVNQFRCNCNITESINYSDFVGKWAPYFMLAESNVAGKRGLRPLLPINSNGTINTGTITPVFTFTEDQIIDEPEIAYTNLADRRPFVAQMIWRQQPDDDFGIIRTAEVRYAGTAPDGPYESHDLSEFCCTENHAVKAGAYILAKRRYTSHTIRFMARPQANSTVVIGGSIVRVRLARNATTGGIGFHDFLYQVERITKTLSGELSYECVHFPIDSQGRSLVALDVANTTGTGIVLSNNRSGLGCDLNSSTDTTIPDEEFTPPDFDTDFPSIDVGGGIGGGFGDGSTPGGGTDNPSDGLDSQPIGPFEKDPTPGGAPGVPPAGVCSNPIVTRIIKKLDANGNVDQSVDPIFETGGEELYSIPFTPPAELGVNNWNFTSIEYSFKCPDGTEQVADPVEVEEVEFDPTVYTWYRFAGSSRWHPTTDPGGLVTALTSLQPGGGNFVAWWVSGEITRESGATGGDLGYVQSQSGAVYWLRIIGGVSPDSPLTVSGSWEFSNNQIDVDAVWIGTGIE